MKFYTFVCPKIWYSTLKLLLYDFRSLLHVLLMINLNRWLHKNYAHTTIVFMLMTIIRVKTIIFSIVV